MSYIFFEDVIEQLGHKLVYDAVVNYAGNSFCENSWEMIMENNPLESASGSAMTKNQKNLLNFFENSEVKVQKGVRIYGKETAEQ